MGTKYKNIMVSFIVGALIFCSSVLRIYLDDTIQMRVIYCFFDRIEQECLLHIDDGETIYNVEPHFPMEDTYAAGWYEVEYEIPKKIADPDSFYLELAHAEDTVGIRSIEFYDHSLQKAKYSPSDIGILFDAEDSIVSLNDEQISITSQNDEIILTGTDNFLYEYSGFQDSGRAVWYNCIILSAGAVFLCYSVLNRMERRRRAGTIKNRLTKEDVMWATALTSIFAFCVLMTFLSKHYAHADEYVTRAAIDYYLGGYIPPASASHWQAGTRSLHGFSRLNETTLYYFFAGKVGWIFKEFFHIQKYYRMIGLILLAVVLVTCWRRRKNNKFLFITIAITPQIWYLFSYATSDHWDWFWGFWILIITLDTDSVLYRAIEKRGTLRQCCLYMVLCAALFAQMFLGKENYLIVLALPLINLMIYWIYNTRCNLRVLACYLIILIISLGINAGIKNFPREGTPYSVEMTEEETQNLLESRDIFIDTARREYASDAPVKRGVAFWDMLWDYAYMPTPALLFTSAIGYYVWNSLWGGTLYSLIMLMLYIAIGIGMLFSMTTERKWDVKLRMISSGLLAVVSFSVALLYCYYVTYQPQGRYILPIFLILGYAAAYAENFTHSRFYNWSVIMCYLAGSWCFVYAGLYAMHQNGILII